MEQKPNEHQQAQNLYFQTEFTQQQIADMLNINRKTLYLWIKEGGWMRVKYAADHAPSVLVEQYYSQLGALNKRIAEREEQPWPSKEEADTIRKITQTIKQIRNGKHVVAESVEMFQHFTDKLMRKDLALTKKILPEITKHLKDISEEGKRLNFSQHRKEEEKFDKEYAEWLLQEAQKTEKKQQADGVQNGATADTSATSEPLPTAGITENDNSDLSTKKTENEAINEAGDLIQNPAGGPAQTGISIEAILKLPPGIWPSPFRDGNTVWVKNMDDVKNPLDSLGKPWGGLKQGDVVRLYPKQ